MPAHEGNFAPVAATMGVCNADQTRFGKFGQRPLTGVQRHTLRMSKGFNLGVAEARFMVCVVIAETPRDHAGRIGQTHVAAD